MIKVLFVCVENSCRSQMAEGFANALGAGVLFAASAGSNASGRVNETAVAVMAALLVWRHRENIRRLAAGTEGFTARVEGGPPKSAMCVKSCKAS